MIGIGITVHNRHDIAEKTIQKIKEITKVPYKLIVVDDASKEPFKEASHRFNTNVGIAAAKNKTIELLYDANCEHIFLFDDDVYPIVEDWQDRYISTGIKHLCFSFDTFKNGKKNGRIINGIENGIVEYHEPCGCMLYLHRDCINAVGGMDVEYGKWGYEHVGYSRRIHNAGLTLKPFLDVENSTEIFYSLDWDQTVTRSVPAHERSRWIPRNQRKYNLELKS